MAIKSRNIHKPIDLALSLILTCGISGARSFARSNHLGGVCREIERLQKFNIMKTERYIQ